MPTCADGFGRGRSVVGAERAGEIERFIDTFERSEDVGALGVLLRPGNVENVHTETRRREAAMYATQAPVLSLCRPQRRGAAGVGRWRSSWKISCRR